jgi:hypothetical protein
MERRETVTKADEPNTHTPWDLGSTPSPDKFVTPTTDTLAQEYGSSILDVGYYSSEARTSLNPGVSRANHLGRTHDPIQIYCSAIENPDIELELADAGMEQQALPNEFLPVAISNQL